MISTAILHCKRSPQPIRAAESFDLLQWWRGSRSRARRVEPNYARLIGIEVALPRRARRHWLSGDTIQIPTDTAARRCCIWGIARAVLVREAVTALNPGRQQVIDQQPSPQLAVVSPAAAVPIFERPAGKPFS